MRLLVRLAAIVLVAAGPAFGVVPPPPPPAAFSLTAPANAAVDSPLSPTFTWDASAGADTYTLEVATDAGFAAEVLSQSGLLATTYTPGGPLSPSTPYFWRVTAVNTGGSTVATGAPFGFTTVPPGPGAFVLLAPPDLVGNVSAFPIFAWGASASASSYLLEVAYDPGFTSLAISQAGLTTTSFSNPTPLFAFTVYYWRVTAFLGAGSTVAMGAPFSFQTGGGPPGPGFAGSDRGRCGLLGIEFLAPLAAWILRRRLRMG